MNRKNEDDYSTQRNLRRDDEVDGREINCRQNCYFERNTILLVFNRDGTVESYKSTEDFIAKNCPRD